jgi:Tfp pilus assembly protein PilF
MATMKNTLLILFVSLSLTSIAQTYNPEKVNKKAIDLYERALLKVQEGQFKEAIPGITKAIETDPKYVDAILSLASVYGELKDYKSAVEQFEKGKALDTAYFRFF